MVLSITLISGIKSYILLDGLKTGNVGPSLLCIVVNLSKVYFLTWEHVLFMKCWVTRYDDDVHK